ncbi:hypothetical protein [Nesterenkonia populi]
MRATFRRSRKLLQSDLDYYRFAYGSEWQYAFAAAAFLSALVVDWLEPPWNLILTLSGLALTGLLFLLDTRRLRERWTITELVQNENYRNSYPFSPEPRYRQDATEQEKPSWQIIELQHAHAGHGGERVWTDTETNRLLWNCSFKVAVQASPERFALPGDLRDIAPRAVRDSGSLRTSKEKRSQRPLRFNGRLARLSTEPSPQNLSAGGPFQFQQVRYFDGLASNEIWHWSLHTSLADGASRIPAQHAVDARHRPLQLHESRMAHVVGITICAVTADNQVIFVRQSERNAIGPGRFAASASGSLDWADVVGRTGKPHGRSVDDSSIGAVPSLGDLLMDGMLRELKEESNVPPEVVLADSRRITGYWRWLSRGAKTEFSGFVRLSATVKDLNALTLDKEEELFTVGHAAIDAGVLAAAAQGPAADQWRTEGVLSLIDALQEATGDSRPVEVSASTAATWLAAAAYVRAHPEALVG